MKFIKAFFAAVLLLSTMKVLAHRPLALTGDLLASEVGLTPVIGGVSSHIIGA
jgi:hypothetical protein